MLGATGLLAERKPHSGHQQGNAIKRLHTPYACLASCSPTGSLFPHRKIVGDGVSQEGVLAARCVERTVVPFS